MERNCASAMTVGLHPFKISTKCRKIRARSGKYTIICVHMENGHVPLHCCISARLIRGSFLDLHRACPLGGLSWLFRIPEDMSTRVLLVARFNPEWHAPGSWNDGWRLWSCWGLCTSFTFSHFIPHRRKWRGECDCQFLLWDWVHAQMLVGCLIVCAVYLGLYVPWLQQLASSPDLLITSLQKREGGR